MPILRLFGLIFEWHDPKFELVHAQRGYTLEEIASVFLDEYSITWEDDGDYQEQRLLTTGMSNRHRLITVVWTERTDTYRIITAFKPNQQQQRSYNYARHH